MVPGREQLMPQKRLKQEWVSDDKKALQLVYVYENFISIPAIFNPKIINKPCTNWTMVWPAHADTRLYQKNTVVINHLKVTEVVYVHMFPLVKLSLDIIVYS